MTTFVFQDSNDISEIDRKKAEHERVKAETQRIENEESRKLDEENRKSSETTRQEFYENTAIPLVENLRDFDSQITKNTKEIDDAKGEYDTLRARLDRENEKVYETINSKDFLPFEGENVTVEHSKVGFTKDLKVEGRTLQNLWNKRKEAGEQTVFDLKPNTDYTYIIKNLTTGIQINYRYVLTDGTTTPQSKAIDANSPIGTTFLSKVNSSNLRSICFLSVGNVKADYEAIILEGDYTDKEIPEYFEDIKSVGEKEGKISILSNNKNLLNYNPFDEQYIIFKNGEFEVIKDIPSSHLFFTIKTEREVILTTNAGLVLHLLIPGDVILNNRVISSDSRGYVAGGTKKGVKFRIQMEEGTNATPFATPIVNKKEILLPFEYGHKGFINGAKDMLEIRQDGLYAVQRLDKTILNGEQTITLDNSTNPNNVRYSINIKNIKLSTNNFTVNNLICDKFATTNFNTVYNNDVEGVCVRPDKASICVSIAKSKLTTQDVAGLKAWLQENPTTIYYELAKPIETKLDITSLNLETFKDITHVLSENAIAPNLSFKAPVDVPATISTLRTRNENLEQENKELKEEVDIKTLKLHGQDVELTNSDLDLDFRIFELEMNMGLPINLNVKGVKSMARSPFEMMKILILNNNYDREDIEYKASRYLKGGRMTQEEYNEIISLMDANELVK